MVAFFNIGYNGWCMLSLRISESVPVREDGTAMRESAVEIRTDPALKYALYYGLVFN
jgi:hypothetical protein